MADIEVRHPTKQDNMSDFVELMSSSLGITDERSLIPEHMFRALAYTNCLLAAYDDGDLIGFVCKWPEEVDNNSLYGHAFCVKEEYRNMGVGERLSNSQIRRSKENGYDILKGTYDPLLSNNAQLHVHKTGEEVRKYERNFYGDLEMEEVEGETATDRFVVEKRLDGTGIAPHSPTVDNIYNVLRVAEDGVSIDIDESELRYKKKKQEWDFEYSGERTYLGVEIPDSFSKIKNSDVVDEQEWRYATREVFESLLTGNGGNYVVSDFLSNHKEGINRNRYVLTHSERCILIREEV